MEANGIADQQGSDATGFTLQNGEAADEAGWSPASAGGTCSGQKVQGVEAVVWSRSRVDSLAWSRRLNCQQRTGLRS